MPRTPSTSLKQLDKECESGWISSSIPKTRCLYTWRKERVLRHASKRILWCIGADSEMPPCAEGRDRADNVQRLHFQ